MSPPLLLQFAGLAILGGLVTLDERGLLGGILRTPVLAGILAGAIGGDPALGLTVGLVFALLWPAPFRSGGHRAMSPGIAALIGAGVVSLAGQIPPGSSVAEVLSDTGNASVAWALVLGSTGTIVHQRLEVGLRRRLGARASTDAPREIRRRAIAETVGLGVGLGTLAGVLGLLSGLIQVIPAVQDAGWDGGAWPWLVIAAVLGAASQLGRTRGKRSGLSHWAVGLGIGLAGGLVLGTVW